MQESILFNSVIEDDIIQVPETYRNFFKRGTLVAVEVINAPPVVAGSNKSLTFDNFSAIKLDTRNWKFDRDEANERR